MKVDEEIIAEACRIEYSESTGRLFIVFEVKNEYQKQFLKKNWINDIEYKLIDKFLVPNEEK